jgi:acyl-CoA dehydrogenase
MSEQRDMLDKAVSRLFAHLMADTRHTTTSLHELWEKVEELGIPNIFLPEAAGGFDGNWADACVVFRRIGLHAVPAPIGETILARRWLLNAAIEAPAGPITLGLCAEARIEIDATMESGPAFFSGSVADVPWGAEAQWLLVAARVNSAAAAEEYWLLLPTAAATIAVDINTAGEPRATLHYSATSVSAFWRTADALQTLFAAAALLRTGQMAGALEATLQLSIDYANERKQFGRSIGKFQAIQQQLALLAEETAAAGCAALSACYAADCAPHDCIFEIGAAKLRANRAAAQATAIAHQVHGAIGFTHEHSLHRFTLRLLAWRGEFGNDRYWANYLGRAVCESQAGSLWQLLTARGDRMPIAPERAL